MRQMQKLQAWAEHLQHENDQLRSQVEKSLELGKDVQDGNHAEHPVVCNKGKEPIVSNNEAPTDDELSSGRLPYTSPSPGRIARGNARAKSRRKHSHRSTLNDAVSGTSRRGREQVDRRQHETPKVPETYQCYLTA